MTEVIATSDDVINLRIENAELKSQLTEKDKQIEELKEELHREVLLRVEDRKQGKVWYNELEEKEAQKVKK